MLRRALVLALVVGATSMDGPRSARADDPPSAADLVKAKADSARRAYEAAADALRGGKADAERVRLWSVRLMEAERDLSDKEADRLAALESHLNRMKELRKVAEELYKQASVPSAEVVASDYYIAEASLWVAQAKSK